MMRKTFVAVMALILFNAISVYAQENSNQTQTEETSLDQEADNLNIVSYEERLKLKRSNTNAIDMKLKNSRKGEISDIIKNMNQAEKKAARLEGRTAEIENVNPSDKKAVREFLQKDLFLDPHPRLY